jgi:hypothetical protein
MNAATPDPGCAATEPRAVGARQKSPEPGTLDDEIDEWVAVHLADSPEWGEEKWAAIGEVLGIQFTAPPTSR